MNHRNTLLIELAALQVWLRDVSNACWYSPGGWADLRDAERALAANAAVFPIPLGWLAAYVCLWLTRWVSRGFAKP